MIRHLRPLVALLGLSLVACGGPGGASLAADQGGFEPVADGAGGGLLPEAVLPRLDGDGDVDTADLVGRPAVLNVWATWCAFCVEELPELEEVHRELAGAVRFVGIDREDDRERARELAARTGVSFELVEDRDGSYVRALEVRGMPSTVFVDADGVIRYRHTGPLAADRLRELIAEHLDRRP